MNQDDFLNSKEPFSLFNLWLQDAENLEPNNPNAMALATVDEENMPNVRVVLLKSFDEKGFVFYTNLESQKGKELLKSPKAALNFHWKSLNRQIRIRGHIQDITSQEADDYFKTRPRGSQIGAFVSKQSRPLESRDCFENELLEAEKHYSSKEIERPSHWSGFRLKPLSIEFWQEELFRLHKRIVFFRKNLDQNWSKTMLYP